MKLTLAKMGREQENGHSQFMVNKGTLYIKLAYLEGGGTNVSLPNTRQQK